MSVCSLKCARSQRRGPGLLGWAWSWQICATKILHSSVLANLEQAGWACSGVCVPKGTVLESTAELGRHELRILRPVAFPPVPFTQLSLHRRKHSGSQALAPRGLCPLCLPSFLQKFLKQGTSGLSAAHCVLLGHVGGRQCGTASDSRILLVPSSTPSSATPRERPCHTLPAPQCLRCHPLVMGQSPYSTAEVFVCQKAMSCEGGGCGLGSAHDLTACRCCSLFSVQRRPCSQTGIKLRSLMPEEVLPV